MNQNNALLLAFVAGAMLAAQAALNARLTILLDNALMASSAAFLTAFISVALLTVVTVRSYPGTGQVEAVPVWLWGAGGVLSALAVSTYIWLIPRIGLGPVITVALAGQLVTAVVAGHFGWRGLPMTPLRLLRSFGALALIGGAWMVTHE